MNFRMFNLDLEKTKEPEIKLPTSVGSSKKQESSRETSSLALLTMPKHERDGNTRPPDLPLEKPVYRSGSNRTGYGTTDWFEI